MTWNVGDEIVVEPASYNRRPRPALRYVVTRVARKYFYAKEIDSRYGLETAFEIATGREKDNGFNYYARAYMLEQWEVKQRRDALIARLWAHGVRFDFGSDVGVSGSRLTDGEMESILGVLDTAQSRISPQMGVTS